MNTEDTLHTAPAADENVLADTTTDAGGPAAGTPPLYRTPVLLSPREHAHWRLLPGDAGFAAASHAVPLVVGEFAAAARDYPLVFVGAEAAPVAVLGLQAEHNRFVVADQWQQGAYVPAYVRRYPFVFARIADPDGYALAIDADAPMLRTDGEDGLPLFDPDGQPSALTRQALQFCEAFTGDANASRAFSAALVAAGVLVERQADIVHPDGHHTSLLGFQVVDAERFTALPDATVLAWHRQGWLALVHFHLASLARFPDLLKP
ncbi:SapC family protein [Stenotrophomonas rhizophila]|uniref:SapC family protein n=1 Tax=Stenotrophomonas rhizophila TaxID=216778 RepID=UPI001E2A4B13|nr:SapC family protein [Stenotrophomonas rhizophila]MCC7634407.1 SapC family protein [Stenotrophomonas rhizophila]MCC7663805.1 SapC family protein [Stenotrophomonas rhizophila]